MRLVAFIIERYRFYDVSLVVCFNDSFLSQFSDENSAVFKRLTGEYFVFGCILEQRFSASVNYSCTASVFAVMTEKYSVIGKMPKVKHGQRGVDFPDNLSAFVHFDKFFRLGVSR